MKHVSVLVRGRVQGVFYRASAKRAAHQFGIRGFVRNEPDGSVYIEAIGEDPAIEKFLGWCRMGPPQAKVTDFHIEEINPPASFTGFEIRRE